MPLQADESLDTPVIWDASPEFLGGMRSNARASLLQGNEAAYLQNMDQSLTGELTTRRGTKQLGNNLQSAIQGICYFKTPTTEELIVASSNILQSFNGSSWIYAGGSAQFIRNGKAVFAQGVDKMFIAQAGEPLRYYSDGVLNAYPYTDVSEVSTVDVTGVIASNLHGGYFTVYDATDVVHFQFVVDGAIAPVLGDPTVTVPLYSYNTDDGVARKIVDAVNSYSSATFTATRAGTVVTITCIATGSRTDISSSNPTVVVAVTTQGQTENLAPPLGMNLICWHTNRLVGAGVSGSPDTVYFSQFLDASLWDRADWSVRVGAGEGDPVTALASWSNYNLVVFKQHSVWNINCTPTVDVAEFTVNRIHDRIGCPAPQTCCQVGTDIFFLSDSGVRSIKNTIASEQQKEAGPAMSEPVDDYIKRINPSAVSNACAFHWQNRYILSIPIDGSAINNCTLVFNTKTETWSGVWTGWTPVAFSSRQDGGQAKMWFGQSDGTISEWYDYIAKDNETDTYFQDNGVDIESVVLTKAYTCSEPLCTKTGETVSMEFSKSRASVTATIIRDDSGEERWYDFETRKPALTLPQYLPFTLLPEGNLRVPKEIAQFSPWIESQIKLSSSSLKLSLRSVALSAFVNPYIPQ